MKAEDFQKIIDDKMSMTESLLRVYSTTFIDKDKYSLAKTYQDLAKLKTIRMIM